MGGTGGIEILNEVHQHLPVPAQFVAHIVAHLQVLPDHLGQVVAVIVGGGHCSLPGQGNANLRRAA